MVQDITKPMFIFTRSEPHFWYSCNVIVAATHEALKNQEMVYWFETEAGVSEEQCRLIEASAQERETFIYLLSDNMSYQAIVMDLAHVRNLTFLIPIYGNMTVEYDRWRDLHDLLDGRRVALISASHRQCQQLAAFVKGSSLLKLPYPISNQHFRAMTLGRESGQKDEIHLVYAGRLMVQKNIHDLMRVFISAQKIDPRLRLHICGNFHDRGYHLHGVEVELDQFKAGFFELIKRSKGAISYHGFLEQSEIVELNARSDYVITMSTYHDEDFGVSVAQALAQGLRPILSNWGGHPDYLRVLKGSLVDVEVRDSIPFIKSKSLALALIGLTALSETERRDNQAKAEHYFSARSYREGLQRILERDIQPYAGQTELYLKYVSICCRWYPYHKSQPFGRVDYLDVYRSYLEDFIPFAQFES